MTSFEKELNTYVEGKFNKKFTGCPAIITSFDDKTQLASVKPLYKESFFDDETAEVFEKEYPIINNVPVTFPKFGNFVITFPVKKDNECWLKFSSRSLDDFIETDGKTVIKLNESRAMDLNDAVAEFGFPTKKNTISNFDTDNLVIRTLDNNVYLKIKSDGTFNLKGSRLNIGADNASKALALAEKVDQNFNTLSSYLIELTAKLLPGSVVGILPPVPPTFSGNNSTKAFTND